LRRFYEKIYGPNRFFDLSTNKVLGHKVIIHKNLLKSRKTLIDAVYL
jgi:hypothetical protein